VRETGRVRLFRSHRPDYRDGEQMRDFLYVKDCVAMTLHLAAEPRPRGSSTWAAASRARGWSSPARCSPRMGRAPEVEFVDMPESIRDKYQYYTRADVGKLREAGYDAPATPLAAAVRDYVTHYLAPDRRLGDETAA
jgi:ADP-L-glycero-D-manno-heptose 6-epimerase